MVEGGEGGGEGGPERRGRGRLVRAAASLILMMVVILFPGPGAAAARGQLLTDTLTFTVIDVAAEAWSERSDSEFVGDLGLGMAEASQRKG